MNDKVKLILENLVPEMDILIQKNYFTKKKLLKNKEKKALS